jgi:hypothetical protein
MNFPDLPEGIIYYDVEGQKVFPLYDTETGGLKASYAVYIVDPVKKTAAGIQVDAIGGKLTKASVADAVTRMVPLKGDVFPELF